MSTNDEFQLICRAGPKKPRLESLTVNQWSVANIAIMHKLVQDGTLPLSQVFDYLSYSTYMYRLMSAYELVSVYLFNREYRKLQHTHNFRWGTVVGHLSTQHLRLRPPIPRQGNANVDRRNNKHDNVPHSVERNVICRKFNGRWGCDLLGCKYAHVCNVPGCSQDHSRVNHGDQPPAKN